MSPPSEPVPAPEVVVGIAAGRPVVAAWRAATSISGISALRTRPPQAGGARRADIAVAEWSLGYNYGGEWRAESFDAYRSEPDADRLDCYLRLWEGGE